MSVIRHFKVVGGIDSGEKPPPNQSCIDVLEEALEMAKTGFLQNIFVAALTHGKMAVSGWSDVDSAFMMLGIIEQGKTDYQFIEIDQHRE